MSTENKPPTQFPTQPPDQVSDQISDPVSDQISDQISGQFVGGVHHLPVRIYYEDTDFSGVVYHGAYLKFMERGRTEFLRLSGVGHADLLRSAPPTAFAVRRMQIEFERAAKIDDALVVQTRFTRAHGARIEATQSVWRGDETLIRAVVEVACIGLDGRPKRLPSTLLTLIAPFLTGN